MGLFGSVVDAVSSVGGSVFDGGGLDKIGDVFGGGVLNIVGDVLGGGIIGDVGGGVLGDALSHLDIGELFGDGVGTIAGGIIGGPFGAVLGSALGSVVSDSGIGGALPNPKDGLGGILELLGQTPLGPNLAFPGYGGKGQVGPLSLVGQPTTVDNATGVLAAATGLTDVLATAISGGDPELTAQLSAMFLNAISGAETNEQAMQSVRSLMDSLGLSPAEIRQALTAQFQAGKMTKDEFVEHMQYLTMLSADPSPFASSQGGSGSVSKVTGGSASVSKQGNHVDGANGFLFKPVSESDGNLVILLPSDMTGKVESVVLRDAQGNVLTEKTSSGVANGDREHFRFDQAGGELPKNVTVEFQLRDGTVETYQIADPSKRYD